MATDRVEMDESEPMSNHMHSLFSAHFRDDEGTLIPQIMDTDRVEMHENGEPMEAVLSCGKRHANLVATIAWCASRLQTWAFARAFGN